MLRLLFVAAVVSSAGARVLHAQADAPPRWLAELTSLDGTAAGSIEMRQAKLAGIRQRAVEWLALNPAASIDLPGSPVPPLTPLTEDELSAEIEALRDSISRIILRDRSQPFYPGVITVNVTAPVATLSTLSALSPVSDRIDRVDVTTHHALTVSDLIEYLPGVALDRKAPRNQTGISIGGFDSRQVPLYLDGTPVYLPFDGYVDLTRYLTSDVAEVQVARGYSSPLLGPNLLGGVVNVVTRQPRKRLEGEAFVGGSTGNQLNSGVHVGSRWRRFYLQASADQLKSDFYTLSGSFAPNAVQPSDRRVNSSQDDAQYRLRAAWTPGNRQLYAISYSNQSSEQGVPPYSGTAPACPTGGAVPSTPCVTLKYWKWPEWNTNGYYFNSQTGLGRASSLQTRAFLVYYANTLNMFDDGTYSSTNQSASSGTLVNDDRSIGVSGQFDTRLAERHAIGASFFVKHDQHTEQTTTFSRTNVATTTPVQRDRDRQSSFGIQDVVTLSPRLRATVGVSADRLDGLEAQDLSSDRTRVVPFQVQGICATADIAVFDSCTAHAWTFNPVAAVTYTPSGAGTLFVTAARKSRFPTIKDRYSYRAARALPNPTLNPERATTWTTGYSRVLARGTMAQVEVFRSDVEDKIENVFFLSPMCAGGGRAGAGSCQQATNVGSETRAGVNLAVSTSAVPRVALNAHYSFLHREMDGASGVFPTGAPTHKSVATATVRLPREGAVSVSARYQSGALAMSDNGLPLPAAHFSVVDLAGTKPIRSGLGVQVGVKNLFDRDFYYWEGFPEPGRCAYVTLRFSL